MARPIRRITLLGEFFIAFLFKFSPISIVIDRQESNSKMVIETRVERKMDNL